MAWGWFFKPLSALFTWLKVQSDQSKREIEVIRSRLDACEEDRRNLHIKHALAEATGAENRAELHSLKMLSRIGTVTCDQNGIICQAGQNFCDMSGYPVEELIGMHIRELVPFGCRKWVDVAFREVVSGQRELRSSPIEDEMRCKDGSHVQVLVSLTQVVNGIVKYKADVQRRNYGSQFDIRLP